MTNHEDQILQLYKDAYPPHQNRCLEKGHFANHYPGINNHGAEFNKALESLIVKKIIENKDDNSFCLTEKGLIAIGKKPKSSS